MRIKLPKPEVSVLKPAPAHGPAKLREVADKAVSRVEAIITRLYEIQDELKAAQPKLPGAVLLYLYKCNKNCGGCPHIVWRKWAVINSKFCACDIDGSPLKRLRGAGEFSTGKSTAKALIEEALRLNRERRKIVGLFGNIGRTITAKRN